MNDWKSQLKADPTVWLLEEENPSVRYFALKDILDKPEEDPEVQRSRREIMSRGMVPEILSWQRKPAYQETYPRFYTSKYKGLVWQLIVLAELGAEADTQIQEQCEYILKNSQEPGDGGFSQHVSAKVGGGLASEVIPCLTGNMVWILLKFGYLDDPRLQKGITWLTHFMRLNDGIMEEPQDPLHYRYEMCWGSHTCHMGVVKALKALSAIPEGRRTDEVNALIESTSEFMLIHHIYKRSHNLSRTSKPGWLKFGFPLMYQTDALEILDILTALNRKDPRMEDAIIRVLEKQDDMGRWRIENSYASDRLLLPFGQQGEQSKWLTLRAMRVLKRFDTDS